MNIVYTGKGKGKTTAAIGLILRHLGHGKNCLLVRFIKTRTSGENYYFTDIAFEKNLRIEEFGNGFVTEENFDTSKSLAQSGYQYTLEVLQANEFDLVVLDEINVAIHHKLVTVEQALNLMNVQSKATVVFTGRYAPDELIEKADLVTEFTAVKHPYQNGVAAAEGIEF